VQAQWHVTASGQTFGPFNAQQLNQQATSGRLNAASLVWTAGMAAWTPAGQVPQLAPLFMAPPPVAPPPPPPGS